MSFQIDGSSVPLFGGDYHCQIDCDCWTSGRTGYFRINKVRVYSKYGYNFASSWSFTLHTDVTKSGSIAASGTNTYKGWSPWSTVNITRSFGYDSLGNPGSFGVNGSTSNSSVTWLNKGTKVSAYSGVSFLSASYAPKIAAINPTITSSSLTVTGTNTGTLKVTTDYNCDISFNGGSWVYMGTSYNQSVSLTGNLSQNYTINVRRNDATSATASTTVYGDTRLPSFTAGYPILTPVNSNTATFTTSTNFACDFKFNHLNTGWTSYSSPYSITVYEDTATTYTCIAGRSDVAPYTLQKSASVYCDTRVPNITLTTEVTSNKLNISATNTRVFDAGSYTCKDWVVVVYNKSTLLPVKTYTDTNLSSVQYQFVMEPNTTYFVQVSAANPYTGLTTTKLSDNVESKTAILINNNNNNNFVPATAYVSKLWDLNLGRFWRSSDNMQLSLDTVNNTFSYLNRNTGKFLQKGSIDWISKQGKYKYQIVLCYTDPETTRSYYGAFDVTLSRNDDVSTLHYVLAEDLLTNELLIPDEFTGRDTSTDTYWAKAKTYMYLDSYNDPQTGHWKLII